MGVHDFYSHLKIFNAYITVMPGAMEALHSNTLKAIFGNEMPQTWCNTSTRTGSSWAEAPLANLLKFMVVQQQVADQNLCQQ